MAEEDTIFSSKMSYNGIFPFPDFYKFCYDWLSEETGLDVNEEEYSEKLQGDAKNIDIKWSGDRKFTDYFKFKAKVEFKITGLKKVKVKQGGAEIDTNKGKVDIKIKGILIKDYEGKFELTAFKKFMRSVYEKYIITSRVKEYEGKLASACDEFLSQAKAYLDLEGKK
jgi:hypothetical protein